MVYPAGVRSVNVVVPEKTLLFPAEKKIVSPSLATNSPIDSRPSDVPSTAAPFVEIML